MIEKTPLFAPFPLSPSWISLDAGPADAKGGTSDRSIGHDRGFDDDVLPIPGRIEVAAWINRAIITVEQHVVVQGALQSGSRGSVGRHSCHAGQHCAGRPGPRSSSYA